MNNKTIFKENFLLKTSKTIYRIVKKGIINIIEKRKAKKIIKTHDSHFEINYM